MDNESKRIGLYINQDLLNTCDNAISITNATSRSEFISDAIEFYIAWLNSKNVSRVLTPALESVISSKILDTEDKIARVLFKRNSGKYKFDDAVRFQKG